MDYMPGASSLAATHRGKIKNIRLSTLRGDDNSMDPRASILQFEKTALAHDKTMKQETQGMQGTSNTHVHSSYSQQVDCVNVLQGLGLGLHVYVLYCSHSLGRVFRSWSPLCTKVQHHL